MAYDFDMGERFDRVCDALLEAMADDPCLARLTPTVPVNGMGAGNVNARKAVGKIVRAALKERLVYANERQAEYIAHSGSASHNDTPADLMPVKERGA